MSYNPRSKHSRKKKVWNKIHMVEQEKLVHFLAIHTKLVPLLPSYLNNARHKRREYCRC